MAKEWDELIEVIQLMANTFELDRLLPEITRATRNLLGCVNAHIFLHEPGQTGYQLQTQGSALHQLGGIENPAFNELLLPLSSQQGELFGILQAIKPPGVTFSETERKRAVLLGGLVAIGIKRQMLWTEARQKATFEREMQRARQMVDALIPCEPLTFEGYEFSGRLVPASLTGGDLYDIFPLDDGSIGLLVADATGHGIDSTLLVTECRAIIRALFQRRSNLAKVIERANRLMCGPLDRAERFVTLLLGVIDSRRHRFTYVNGGQGLAFHRRTGGRLVTLPPSGLPLGVLAEAPFTTRSIRLEPDDLLFLGTDGLLEWRDTTGAMYGEERLAEMLRKAETLSPPELIEKVFSDAKAFAKTAPNQDDVTLVAVKRCK